MCGRTNIAGPGTDEPVERVSRREEGEWRKESGGRRVDEGEWRKKSGGRDGEKGTRRVRVRGWREGGEKNEEEYEWGGVK